MHNGWPAPSGGWFASLLQPLKTMKRFRLLGALLVGGTVITLLLAGCSHAYRMQVDAEARRGSTAPVSYVVHEAGLANSAAEHPPGWTRFETALDEEMDVDQATAVKYVRTALSAKGMYEAPKAEAADMDVTYAYEIRQQRRLIEWDEPVFQPQTRPRAEERSVGAVDSTGNPITVMVKGTVDLPPSAPSMDSIHHAAEEVVYVKELHLIATERKPAPDTPARVWDISISYEDKDPSMEKAMPLLAAAGCDRIGTNTNGPVVVKLHDKDEVVAFIKRGL